MIAEETGVAVENSSSSRGSPEPDNVAPGSMGGKSLGIRAEEELGFRFIAPLYFGLGMGRQPKEDW